MPRPPPPVVDHPYVFSVSQVETFELCPRKWAFEKIDKIEGGQSDAAALGGEVHEVLEDYLELGKPIDPDSRLGRIAFPGVQYLPAPKTPGMKVEKWFVLKFGVAVYRGLKDFRLMQGKLPLVGDHKTTKDFRWKKTEKELKSDTQAGIYAAHEMATTDAKEVLLLWIYYKTVGKPKAEPVRTSIKEAEVLKILTRVDNTAKRMVEVIKTYKKGEAIQVPPDYSGCSAYGGCPHLNVRCEPKPEKTLRAMVAQKILSDSKKAGTSDFLRDLRERKSKAGGGKQERLTLESVEVPEEDMINSPDREIAEPPPPPPAKKIEGKWIQPEWDDAAFEWKFPGEEVEKAAAKTVTKPKTGSKVPGLGKKSQVVENLDDPEPEQEDGSTPVAAAAAAPVKTPVKVPAKDLTTAAAGPKDTLAAVQQSQRKPIANDALADALTSLLDAFIERLAEKVADKLSK